MDKGVVGMEGVCGGVDLGSVRTAGVWIAAHLINVGAVRAVASVAGRAGAAARAVRRLRADHAGEAGARSAERYRPHAQARSARRLHPFGDPSN